MSCRVVTFWRRANIVVRGPTTWAYAMGFLFRVAGLQGVVLVVPRMMAEVVPEERWRFARRPVVWAVSARLRLRDNEGRTRSLCEMVRSVGILLVRRSEGGCSICSLTEI